MPRIEPKVAQWIEDEVADFLLGIKGLCLRVNEIPVEVAKFDYYCKFDEDATSQQISRHVTEFHIEEILRKYANVNTPMLCVRELGDTTDNAEGNPHYHVFFCTDNTIKAVRSAVSKIWRGNESYSLKQAKPQMIPEHFNYLCKGTGTGSDDGPDVIYRSDHLTDERVTELHVLYWTNNDAFKANSKKRKALSIDEQVFDLCRHLKPPICRGDIYDIIRDFYGKRVKKWRLPYIRDLVFQTQMYLEPLDSNANQFSKTFCTGLPVRPDQ